MSYVDVKYARLVGSRLDLFKEKKTTYTILDALIAETHRNTSLKQEGIFLSKVLILYSSVTTVVLVEH